MKVLAIKGLIFLEEDSAQLIALIQNQTLDVLQTKQN